MDALQGCYIQLSPLCCAPNRVHSDLLIGAFLRNVVATASCAVCSLVGSAPNQTAANRFCRVTTLRLDPAEVVHHAGGETWQVWALMSGPVWASAAVLTPNAVESKTAIPILDRSDLVIAKIFLGYRVACSCFGRATAPVAVASAESILEQHGRRREHEGEAGCLSPTIRLGRRMGHPPPGSANRKARVNPCAILRSPPQLGIITGMGRCSGWRRHRHYP